MGGMETGTNWLPPLLVLGIGLIVGIVLALRFAKGKRPQPTPIAEAAIDDVVVRDLRVRRDSLFAQLRELEETSGKRSAEDLARYRYELELEAARVLRDLDRAEEALRRRAAPAPAPAPAPAGSSAWVGFAWGAGVVLFGAIVFFVLQSETANRMPGGSVTGNTGAMGDGPAQQPPHPDPELEQLVLRAQAAPLDLQAQLDLAQGLLYRNRLVELFQVVQHIRTEIDPDNPSALTWEAVVRQAMGLPDQAMELLDRAVEKDPEHAEAWVRRGLVAFEMARYQDAVDSWEKALALRPDGKEALEPVIAEAKLRAAGKGAGAMAGPAPAAPGAAAPQAAGGKQVRVVLDLDPALRGKVAAGTPVFLVARPAGMRAGPPVAARRVEAGDFPMAVTIGDSDTMMGQPFPDSVAIEARIDADGDAATRSPDDPRASEDGVAAGSEVRLVLRIGG